MVRRRYGTHKRNTNTTRVHSELSTPTYSAAAIRAQHIPPRASPPQSLVESSPQPSIINTAAGTGTTAVAAASPGNKAQ